MVRHSHLRDTFSAFESTGPAHRADPIDEYRDLAMLANAFERVLLRREIAEEAEGRVDDAEGKESAPR